MIQIDTRQLGETGITVPALGVGVWSWGDTGFWTYGSTHTQRDIWQAYQACLDSGLNFFDTAEVYGGGESERILGACRSEDGRPILIASKFAPLPNRLSARTLLSALDASLERLGVATIDLYQIHFPFTLLPTDALMDALALAVRAGKVRAVGVSNYGADHMRRAHARLARHDIPLASNQVHYSLLHRKPEKSGVLAACRELHVALIAYSPLEQALLTGKYRAGNKTYVPSGPRRFMPAYMTRHLRKIEPILLAMEQVAQVHNKTLAQIALNWLLSKDDCIIPIPGAKNLQQAQDNAGAIGWRMTEAEMARLDRLAS